MPPCAPSTPASWPSTPPSARIRSAAGSLPTQRTTGAAGWPTPAAAQNPPRKRPVVIPRGAEEVFESTGGAPKRPAAIPETAVAPAAAGKRGDSVIHRSGWARELFTSPQRVTGRGRAADADILDHLRALGDDDLRSLSHEELMDLLADFEAELSEAQLATVAAIIDEYDDDDGDDEAAPEDVDVGEAPAAPEDAVTSPLH